MDGHSLRSEMDEAVKEYDNGNAAVCSVSFCLEIYTVWSQLRYSACSMKCPIPSTDM